MHTFAAMTKKEINWKEGALMWMFQRVKPWSRQRSDISAMQAITTRLEYIAIMHLGYVQIGFIHQKCN